jgi:hypothetical protein
MMSPGYIAQLSREAAYRAAREHQRPILVEAEDLAHWRGLLKAGQTPHLPFPTIGDLKPKGYTLLDYFMVDNSGFGAKDEPALTVRQLLDPAIGLQVGKAYAIIEVGQFQVVLGEFERNGTKTVYKDRSDGLSYQYDRRTRFARKEATTD